MLPHMAVVQFADGEQVVDDVYVEPIMKETNGSPERFAFGDVMARLSTFVERGILRDVQKKVISEHLRTWGS